MAEKGTMTATFELTPELRGLLGLRDREYVVKDPVEIVVETKDGDRLNPPQDIRERIVRCRDCMHSRREGWECWRLVDDPEEDFERVACVQPDGFCAWGERREQ